MTLVEKIRDTRSISAEECRGILASADQELAAQLRAEARQQAQKAFGKNIYIRGLIGISSYCKNGCFYCGLRAENKEARRYRLTMEQILECCARGYASGFRTFVLQGGEDPARTDEWLEDLIGAMRAAFPECAITLSLGEKPQEAYRRFRAAGADRYLLRHETFNAAHYARLHPAGMSRERRLECLRNLKELGYQTGSGIMVGSPYQTIDNIVEDVMFLQELRPEMIGIGPFVHHNGTPFAGFPDGSVELTLKLISIFRLLDPHALIPATTALSTLDKDGRRKGILAGANVVMPSLTPADVRGAYSLYEGMARTGAESAEGLDELKEELAAIGCTVAVSRGDYMI